MKKFFSMLFSRDVSAFVDGTHVSKYSEKVLNTLATVIYYVSLISAIMIILAGIYVFLALLLSLGNGPYRSAPDDLLMAFVALIGSLFIGMCIFGTGVIISSAIRVLCNISLSLKLLTRSNSVQVQTMGNDTNYTDKDYSTTVTCPECGFSVQQGSKSCPECGCPL